MLHKITRNTTQILEGIKNFGGHAVAPLAEALRYKSGGRGVESRLFHCNFFSNLIILTSLCPWGRLSL
jgi:hypothetical protein